jgi:hypothetical protein
MPATDPPRDDTARIDWIEHVGPKIWLNGENEWIADPRGEWYASGKTLREAIDNAMDGPDESEASDVD